jgi:hypothetical protein
VLEQWEADRLLAADKIYTHSTTLVLTPGASDEYQVEDADGHEFFLLDVWCSRHNAQKGRFQLRYRRSVVLARLCTAVPHTNPDGGELRWPHFHRYREDYEDKWAEQVGPSVDLPEAMEYFCNRINLARPDIQGGIS